VVEPLTELRDAPLSWYVGLSADATRIGDAIWNENETDSALAGASCRPLPVEFPQSVGF